ncbi:MAG: hypothetical protein NZ740_02840 [Kiritimatiellae bacterium]|nr:hypothetical protein [Kiritimatiellia bacterium]MDW8458029.1 hypothetical protein [Verrucomicrobiota bacterium]
MNKKYLPLIAVVVALPCLAQAALIAEGSQELRLQGSLDPSTVNGSELRLNASYGYFFLDNAQAGGRLDFADNKKVNRIGLGAFAEYNVDTETDLTPFAEFFAGFANVDVEGVGGDDLAGILEFRAGAKYFLAEQVAVAAAGVFAYATEDIYPDEEKLRDTDVFMELSLRCYF